MKINERNMSYFAGSRVGVDREGFLLKKSDNGKSFAKRWFVLKGNLLFYFDKKSDQQPNGLIVLEGSSVELAEVELNEPFCFKIYFSTKVYTLAADSQLNMEQWMRALASSTYDYVRLVSDELQRQLDQLTCSERILYGDHDAALVFNKPRLKMTEDENKPEPPPRTKYVPGAQLKTQSFLSLHQEYGSKILRSQEARSSRSSPSHARRPKGQSDHSDPSTADLIGTAAASLSLHSTDSLSC